jgi:hypothetical protein
MAYLNSWVCSDDDDDDDDDNYAATDVIFVVPWLTCSLVALLLLPLLQS